MFVILTLLFTTVLAHSHEKYIDLLPEEEKQQFLDKVARRIMETVESGEEVNGDKVSRELTDEQLKGHSRFVQEILRQESAMLKKRRAGLNLDLKAVDKLEVVTSTTDKNDDSLKRNAASEKNDANSSVKKVKRRSTEEELPENSTDYIKVHIVTEQALPMQKRSESSDGENNKNEESPNEISKEVEPSTDKTKDLETSATDFNMQTEEPEAMVSTTDSQGLIIETESTNYIFTTKTPETNYKILRATGSSHEDSDLKEGNVDSEINEKKTQAPVNDTPTEGTEGNSVKTDENSEDRSTKSSVVERSNTNNKDSLDVSNKKSPKSIFIDLDDYSTPPTRATEFNVATTVDHYQPVTEKSLSKSKLPAITPKTTVLPAFTPKSHQKKTNKKQKRTRDTNTRVIKRSENTTIISYIASNALKKVKSKYDHKKRSKSSKKQDTMATESNKNSLSYRIYEMPSSKLENSPYLRGTESVEDSPLYVPVYRYSPNNAYYDPTNRRGPNAVEEISIELDPQLRGGEKNKAKRPVPEEFILQLNNDNEEVREIRKFAEYHKTVKEYGEDIPAVTTPIYPKENNDDSDENNDDSDENTSKESLPDSNEKWHPMNSMGDGMKTHIQSIRDILFKNKHYGPQGPEHKADLIRDLYGNTKILHKYDNDYKTDSEKGKDSKEQTRILIDQWKNKKKKARLRSRDDDNIDIDYYYGRMDKLNDKINDHIKGLYNIHLKTNDDKQNNDDYLTLKYVKDKNRSNKKEKYSKESNKNAKELRITTNKVLSKNMQPNQEQNFEAHEKNGGAKVSTYMKALKDLINQDSKALKQYDWLATTVQIQGALEKLFRLIGTIRESKPIHPADVQLLKYTAFLHNFSLELKRANDFKTHLKQNVELLPQEKKKIGEKLLKERNLLNMVWMRVKTLLPNLTSETVINDLNDFLLDVEKALQDLHEAIKNISQVTNFKHQYWFANIKQLYLTTGEKHLREVLLHITFIRLLELIEQGAENGMEKNFVGYMKAHRKESKKTLEEMMFVTKILDEIKKSSNE